MRLLIGFLGIFLLYFFLYKIYTPRVNAFGCFDDCNNFMGGYFLLHGKKLFSEIFFNHNLGMAYLSALIQWLTHPQNLYDLVLKHRQFVFGFGLVMNVLLYMRFGYKALGFTFVYELTKFYLFGDRFLAEGIIVYPIVFLVGLTWEKLQQQKLLLFDYVLAGLFVWFVIWMREPYIPLALCLFGIVLWGRDMWKEKSITVGIVTIFSCVTFFYHNISELIFNVFTVNAVVNIPLEDKSSSILGVGIFKAFFYPLVVLFSGQQTFLRSIEIPLSVLFLLSLGFVVVKKQWKLFLLIFITLGLSNLRYTPPGKEFYDAFHQIVWYGLFIFFTVLLLQNVTVTWARRAGAAGIIVLILYTIFLPQSFWHEKANPYEEFITNYGKVLQVGEIVSTLSKPTDTLFVDGYDDMIYWVAKRYSSYQYSWYTSLMPAFPKYTTSRISMLNTNPPDFYYGSCLSHDNPNRLLPSTVQTLYVRLLDNGKPSCLWIKKSTIAKISQQQWDKAKEGYYTLPSVNDN